MLSYEFYKIAHLSFIVFMFSAFAIQIWSAERNKVAAILSGVVSLLVFVAGMGLMARLSIGHTEGWPVWIKVKVGIWAIITIATPIIIKRCPKLAKKWFLLISLLFIYAAYSAVHK